MAIRPRYPYPQPELIAYLERAQRQTQDRDHIYSHLARLLKICHATIEHAHALWQGQCFQEWGPELATSEALQYSLGRLVPLILEHTPAGWAGLLNYVEHPEQYAWYDSRRDWPLLPPLQVKDEEELVSDDPAPEAARGPTRLPLNVLPLSGMNEKS